MVIDQVMAYVDEENRYILQKEYGIHDYINSRWDRKPEEVLKEMGIPYERYLFFDPQSKYDTYPERKAKGYLYVYKTDPLTNEIIFQKIGVTENCPIDEIEIPR